MRSSYIALGLGAVLCGPALAQDEWSFRVSPYLWVPRFEVTSQTRQGDEFTTKGKTFDLLAAGAQVAVEASRGPWSFVGDYNYLNLSNELAYPSSLDFRRMRLKGSYGTLAAGYSFYDYPEARVEAFAGVRFWDLKARLEGYPGQGNTDIGGGQVTDPLIGMRVQTRLRENWVVRGSVDVGGFGLEGASKFQTMAVLAAGYDFTDQVTGLLGYRFMNIEFQDDNTAGLVQEKLYGPFMGVDFRF